MSLEGTLLNEKSTALVEPEPSGPEELISTRSESAVQNLVETFAHDLNISETNFLYIISRRWLQEWKQQCTTHGIMTTDDFLSSNNLVEKFNMGKINQDIVKEESKFLTYPDEDDYRNVVLKEGLEENIDYELMTESEWKYFTGIFDHIAIKRPVHILPNGEKKVEIELKKVRIIPLNNHSFRGIDHKRVYEFRIYCLQVSTYASIQEFKSDFIRILNLKKNEHIMITNLSPYSYFYTTEVSEESSHLWVLDPALDLKSFFQEVRAICVASPSYDYRIQFKGQYLEKNSKLRFNEVDLADEDVIFMDSPSSGKGCVFFGDGAKVLQKCGFCSDLKELNIPCECHKVVYCSEDCKVKDKRFHARRCPVEQALRNQDLF